MNKKTTLLSLSILLLFGCSQSGETISRSTTGGVFDRIAQDENGFYYVAPTSNQVPEPVISYYSFQNHASSILNSNHKQCS